MQGLLLKSSMALPGKESGIAASPEDVAGATIRAFLAAVPKNVAGIVFLSGGQTAEEATLRLNAIAKLGQKRNVPWPLTFSYSRALQDPVMAAWLGKRGNGAKAQEIFKKRVAETAAASEGKL
jgi:fructose-bisphosphate aldolase class I